jgi:hypothetical protein
MDARMLPDNVGHPALVFQTLSLLNPITSIPTSGEVATDPILPQSPLSN